MRTGCLAFLMLVSGGLQGMGWAQDIIDEVIFEPQPAAAKATTLEPSKRVSCALAANAPVMDGRLDDACWTTASRLDGFVISGSGRAPVESTEARIVGDAQALYVGILCRESQMAKLVAPKRPHDFPIWNDDVVEVLVDPTDQRVDDYHFILSASGAQYEGHERRVRDARGGHIVEGPKWNAAWQGAVFHGSDFWSAEIEIPFASMGVSRAPESSAWAVEIMREEQPRGEVSVWSCAAGGFGRMENWGYLVFGNPEVLIRRLTVESFGWGENVASVWLESTGNTAIKCVVVGGVALAGGGTSREQTSLVVSLGPTEIKRIEVPFSMAEFDKQYELSVCCMDPSRKRLLAKRSIQSQTPSALEFSLPVSLLYLSEDVLIGSVEVGAASRSLQGLRLAGCLKAPDGKVMESKPVPCSGRKGEIIFRVPPGGAGEYRVGVGLLDAASRQVASREARFQRIRGPFDK